MALLNQFEPTAPVTATPEEAARIREAQLSAYTGPDAATATPPTSVLGAPPTVAAGSSFVTPEATVSGQLNTLLQRGSPLMTLAESRAAEEANKRGLLSSSMAVGAGQKALYDTALDIATPDAATYSKFGLGEQSATYGLQETGYKADIQSVLEANKANLERGAVAQRGQIESELSAQAATQAMEQQREVDTRQMERLQTEQTALADREARKILSQEGMQTEKLTSDEAIAQAQIIKDVQMQSQKLAVDLELQDMKMAETIAQIGMQVDQKNQEAFSEGYSSIIENYNADFRSIQALADDVLSDNEKTYIIAQMQNQVQNEIQMLGDLHGFDVSWSAGGVGGGFESPLPINPTTGLPYNY